MDGQHGPNRGSFIWGRSVHNTRIERLWYDVTTGFGRKWKEFFMDLEANHSLDPSNPHHIWLLHTLFLAAINEEAQQWAHSWNSHKIEIRGERRRSPRDMFFFGMAQEGIRGTMPPRDPVEEEVPPQDLPHYGVDWDVIENAPQVMAHREDADDIPPNPNPFTGPTIPAQFSAVICEPPNCPFSEEERRTFEQAMARDPLVDLQSHAMPIRRLVWQRARLICATIYEARVVPM
ncbi:hypothetical protein BC835DRAFT_1408376 [Cytidiella melzeri]|nr:hypothetical protein BC835DRAFT_1409637 [Cytidiella melzeri]KAI0687208.1 hypothetical protein BC835DRAFT_1408376 [Cytidiella melzeri]